MNFSLLNFITWSQGAEKMKNEIIELGLLEEFDNYVNCIFDNYTPMSSYKFNCFLEFDFHLSFLEIFKENGYSVNC